MATESRGLIYEKMPLVMADLGAIGKERTNSFHKYNFRGIDDVYNACHAVLVKHGVFTIPYVVNHKVDEYVDEKGRRTIHVVAEIEYQFYASDGSTVRCRVLGEGADSGDKACNKAMASAHKYALIQSLCIPTEEQKDSEYDSPDLSGERRPALRTEPMSLAEFAERDPQQRLARAEAVRAANAMDRHPTVEAAEHTFGVVEGINDEQYNDILGHFERLKWPRPHATNYLKKHYGVTGPKELTNKKAAECLIDLEARTPEAKEAK